MDILNEFGIRIDGRLPNETRNIKIEYMNGPTILYSQGLTEIRTAVVGPKPKTTRSHINICLSVGKMTSIEIKNRNKMADDMKYKIMDIFQNIIIVKPASCVDFDIVVLQDNGSLFSAIVNSMSICCAYAGIQIIDLVLSCTVGVFSHANLFDMCISEEDYKLPSFTICYGINRKTLFGTYLVGPVNTAKIPQVVEDAVNCIHTIEQHIVTSLRQLK